MYRVPAAVKTRSPATQLYFPSGLRLEDLVVSLKISWPRRRDNVNGVAAPVPSPPSPQTTAARFGPRRALPGACHMSLPSGLCATSCGRTEDHCRPGCASAAASASAAAAAVEAADEGAAAAGRRRSRLTAWMMDLRRSAPGCARGRVRKCVRGWTRVGLQYLDAQTRESPTA